MGTYVRTLVQYADNRSAVFGVDDPEGLGQNYDAFAVLVGVKNYHYIAPMFPQREEPDFVKDVDRGRMGYHYHYKTYFTLEEFEAFDFDQPLKFLPNKKPLEPLYQHRADDVQDGDTYRSFIERETFIFKWIATLKNSDTPVTAIALFFD